MRLFVAVEVPPAVRGAVSSAVAGLREAWPGWRWVDPDRYHLTLVFLGSLPEERVAAVSAAASAAVSGSGPFELALDGRLGTFGRRVLWAGVQPSPALAAVAAAVSSAVGAVVDLPDGDRDFSAHLTLARAGRTPIRSSAVREVEVAPVAWRVPRVVLMKSAGGYSVVEAFPFVADA